MSGEVGVSATEMMIVVAARQLAGERVCFVGVGPPNIACNLAKRTVAPDLELVYESGVFGSARWAWTTATSGRRGGTAYTISPP